MGNLFDLLKLKNSTSRNGFDLSFKNLFTAKAGELLPVACIETLPGDKFKIRTEHFTRTEPLVSAAYARMNEYFDWYFVPTNLLWNKFNTFVTQMGNNGQQAQAIDSNVAIDTTHPYLSTTDIHTYLENIEPQNLQESDQQYGFNMFGYQRNLQSAKLLEYLNYGRYTVDNGSQITQGVDMPDTAVTPFPLLAYQKIYSDHYRNSQWEQAFAPTFNINYMTGGTNTDKKIPISTLRPEVDSMLELRYANWSKDYFMGVLPNSQYGDVASVNISSLLDNVNIINTSSSAVNQSVNVSAYRALYSGSDASSINWNITTSNNLIGAFSILALRNAEAMQKWKEITQSQEQDYQSQIMAHFGVHVSDAYSERSTYIGGGRATININAITNNNLPDDQTAQKANIRGTGDGAGKDYVDFSTDVHGYLMCIYHCRPSLDYSITALPKKVTKTKVTDYAIPEFDRTGMVQVPLVELSADFDKIAVANGSSRLLGYAPRYYDYKASIDEVHGAFVNGGYQNWVAPFTDDYVYNYLENLGRVPLNSELLNYVFFKICPNVLDSIFGYNATERTDSDQFKINSYFDIKVVRNLDRNGLPY